ncbi:hypothetical protein N7492_007657 [Penicillium capsulatum]|uniref:Uncharacterized protein n=1 Tax=Penicillium capsulatum TaxID=69766 RepID=A0A9W9I5J1_9EURO|nr:hypothetical protein N7492_007657 [Penicillium capsulatum]KAJ6117491.1 hypothetical protein N7512_007216 [Penicillium capsulatum]
MANNTQGRPGQLPSPPSADSPLSPASGSSNPISFRPNVNRAKTKRWVEAKQYSYDGGDWGDEDDEEEEEEEPAPPPVSRPPYTNRAGSSSELSSRRLSGLALGTEESRRSPSVDVKKDLAGGDSKNLPFVRPADIYKRMREETTSPTSPGSAAQAEAPPSSLQVGAASPAAVSGHREPEPELNTSGAGQETPTIGLPEVKRISAFGTDFIGGSNSTSQQPISPESPQTSLKHNPSQSSEGFTSIVHQAFDVPETPNSTTGSVVRSNSDGTSVISPIMGNRGPHDDKTPTIPEEPAESNTPTGNGPREGAREGPMFITGHRRDMSLPGGENSPSKTPTITDHEAPPAGQAEMSTVSSADPSEKDFVAPLKFGSNGNAGSEGYRGEIPTIVPAGAEDSPEDTDNDRLREEIIRSLSRENSQEPEVPPQHPGVATGSNPGETSKALASESHPDVTGPHPLASRDPYAGAQAPGYQTQAAAGPPRGKLERRFSWESETSSENPATQIPGSYSSPPPLSTALATQEPEPIPEDAGQLALDDTSKELHSSDVEESDGPRVEKPRLSIIPPVPESSSPPEQIMGPVDAPKSPNEATPLPSNVGTISLDESKLKGFRDILNMTLPNERIRAFDQTRDQFAALDTGLNHWVQVTISENPDHFDLVQQSRSLSSGFPRPSPSRTKFPKLGSLGNLSASREDSTPTSATHIRRPSGHIGTIVNRQNVGERSKEFLHTAGAFGGKAGEAAKGLFAKGRSKFRPSGGTDKGQSTTARRSLHFSFTSEANGSPGNSSLRNSVNLGSLPMFKFGGSKDSTAKEQGDTQERAGKRFKSVEAMDHDSAPNTARRQSEGFTGNSDFAGDLEREMNAALGLSPTEARSRQAGSTEPAIDLIATDRSPVAPPPPAKDDVLPQCKDCGPAGIRPSIEKELPPPPEQDPESSSADVAQLPNGPVVGTSQAVPISIRPVVEEERPSLPPKDDPKETSKEIPSRDLAPPDASHTGQPSVSTLGADERGSPSAEGDVEEPPSPLQPAQEAKSEEPVYGKPPYQAKNSDVSRPSVEEHVPGFGPVYPPKTASSAQILESKRRSISGLPPSAPGIQSPLRNEVRYSPGTRSSMLSFGSFGRQSTNSKGTRPVTPVNGLSGRRGSESSLDNGDSTMEKLRSFGKRRRASVGDMLSGIQDGIQGGLQGLQTGGQNKGQQRKRTFSRISVCLGSEQSSGCCTNLLQGFFNRSQESQNLDSSNPGHVRANSQDLDRKVSSTTSSNDQAPSTASEDKILPSPPVPGLASSLPPIPDTTPTARASHRMNMPSPANASGGGRFYSQIQAASTAPSPQHSRVKSQPIIGNEPLSPVAPSNSDKSRSPPLSDVRELDEQESLDGTGEEPAVPEEVPSEQGQESQPEKQTQSQHTRVDSQPATGNEPHPPIASSNPDKIGSPPLPDAHGFAVQEPHNEAANEPVVSQEVPSENGQENQPQQPEQQSQNQHARVKSQPVVGNEPLPPIAPSHSEKSGSPPLPDAQELAAQEPQKETAKEPAVSQAVPSEQDQEKQPQQREQQTESQPEDQTASENQKSQESDQPGSKPIHPKLSVRSRKPVGSNPDAKDETLAPKNITVSNASTISTHPHRDEARVLNETPEPVELALTKDDSSEELVMSPTAYPGQEWTPMHL